MLHLQAKIYGLPPHLLAECTWEELRFNQEVLEAGLASERAGRAPGKGRRGHRRPPAGGTKPGASKG